MRVAFGEMGSFVVELICGSVAFASIAIMWPMIRTYMDRIVVNWLI